MLYKDVLLFLLVCRFVASAEQEQEQEQAVDFTYNGFQGVHMISLDGLAHITDNGLLTLVNTSGEETSHAFYHDPIHFTNSSTGTALSFSTTFVFAIFSQLTTTGGSGIVFVISPSREISGALPSEFIGLFNATNIGLSSNHIIGIELDTLQNKEFSDINGNHVGVDVNGLKSVVSAPASYFSHQQNRYVNLSLISGHLMQLWVEYDGTEKQLNVTLAPITIPKPKIPLLSLRIDISQTIVDPMFVGFSSSSSSIKVAHYVLGWSFKMNGQAKQLSLSQLPKLPLTGSQTISRLFKIGFPVIAASLVLMSIFIIRYYTVRRKKKLGEEIVEDWELEYGPYRFKYEDLYIATKGFNDKEHLGTGGFGKVYKGILPNSKNEVAVKRVSHDSRQGVREFIAEIVSIGKIRHRNIVTLLGYCRTKRELLLVYDFMPNGSLDQFLFDKSSTKKPTLSWNQRFQIIKSVASALQYLHNKWDKIVVHRDIKSSNVMLDRELNGKLGDFGLSRLYDHGGDPKTTRVMGTFGYLAPEAFRTGKVNPSVDVFAFGVFLLEVACGRRPIEQDASEESIVLVEWVISSWSRGTILETVDPKLGMNYEVEEIELVLKLGLLCSHCIPTARPSMLQVVRYLDGEVPLPELSSLTSNVSNDQVPAIWCPGDLWREMSPPSSSLIAESRLSGGR